MYVSGLNHPETHSCQKTCRCCHDAMCDPPADVAVVKCATCLRYFKGDLCLQQHRNNGTCAHLQRCPTCFLQMVNGKHNCGRRLCTCCQELVDCDHLCFMQKPLINALGRSEKKKPTTVQVAPQNDRKKKPLPKPNVFYFDIEAMQETRVHKANLVVVQHEDGTPESRKIFKNDATSSARDKFCDWVFKEHCGYADAKQPFIFVAHYLKGYDGYFVLEYLYIHKLFPSVIFTGSKLMTVDVPQLHVKFVDSFNFLAMALAKFPPTFGLVEMRKGYFPHLFNTEANQGYIGPMPPLAAYGPDNMPTPARTALMQWHAEQVAAGYQFVMQREIVEYCVSDVNILREGMEKFRSMCKGLFTLDPLLECITLPSYCHLVYRTHHMPEDSIAIIPAGGYGGRAKQSAKALRWLEWVHRDFPVKIRHARSTRGEVRVSVHFKVALDLMFCIKPYQLLSRSATTSLMASTVHQRPSTNFTGVSTTDARNATCHPWKTQSVAAPWEKLMPKLWTVVWSLRPGTRLWKCGSVSMSSSLRRTVRCVTLWPESRLWRSWSPGMLSSVGERMRSNCITRQRRMSASSTTMSSHFIPTLTNTEKCQ